MISIQRTDCPAKLLSSKAKDAYRLPEVVEELWQMQEKKCCYSEIPIPATGDGKAVEHFQPKAIFKSLRNNWENLLLACSKCNGKKSDDFPVMLASKDGKLEVVFVSKPTAGKQAIIDPSDDSIDPEKLLDYCLETTNCAFYGQVIPRFKTGTKHAIAKQTIEVTGIEDPFFLRERRAYLHQVLRPAYDNLLTARDSEDNARLETRKAAFESLLGKDAKFSGLARAYAKRKKVDKCFGILIPVSKVKQPKKKK